MKQVQTSTKPLPWFALALMIVIVSGCSSNNEARLIHQVQAAVSATCNTDINFTGDHVFACKQDIGGFAGMLLIGGYTTGDGKEMGFYLPWYSLPGTYSIGSINSAYYDPNNQPTDPLNSSDQYGGIEGSVTIVRISYNGDEVTEFELQFNNVKVYNLATDDTLCLNNGLIK